jgi:hypothetical protein
MTATRTFFIGLRAKPCMGAPTAPFNFKASLMHPDAIATAPIHAAPFRKSRLFESIFNLSFC